MRNRFHTLSVDNTYSILCGFHYWSITFIKSILQQATTYNVCVPWCYQDLSIAQGSRHQATQLSLEKGAISNCLLYGDL